MKKIAAIVLMLILVASFVTGILISKAEAGPGGCKTYCEACTCSKFQCCQGVCTVIGTCWPICPACPPPA